MALTICPECKREISLQAPMCPGCGYPLDGPRVEPKKKSVTTKVTQGCLFAIAVSLLLLSAIVFIVLIVPSSSKSESGADGSTSLNNCIARGIDYYREIGSYPYLTDGRKAESVARERCGRTPSAF